MERQPEVIVVGAGIVGLATALYLSEAGARVVVVERDAIASGASGAAAGILSAFSVEARPPVYELLVREGLRLHRRLGPDLQDATGTGIRLASLTILYPAFDESDEQRLRARAAELGDEGPATEWVSGGEARALEQRLSPRARGALVVPDQLRVDAYLLTLALAQAAERHGATIRYAEVTGLVRDGERVRGVRLRNGLMHADRVVLAGGPWTGRMAAWTGGPLPVTPLRGQLLRLKAGGPAMQTCLMYGKGYLVDKGDGLVLAGTTEERAGFRVRPTRTGRAAVITEALRLAPSLRDAAVVEQTACLRPLSADLLPLLGLVPGSAGLFVAAGHGRQGILLGPISGRLTAELVLGKPPSFAIEAFDPARFRAEPVAR